MTTKCLSVLLGEIYAYLNWIFLTTTLILDNNVVTLSKVK